MTKAKFFYRMLLIAAASFSVVACQEEEESHMLPTSIPGGTLLNASGKSYYSGEELYKSIIFLNGPLTEHVPELVDLREMVGLDQLRKEQWQAITQLIDYVIQDINQENPGYFDGFQKQIYSRKHLVIDRTLREVTQLASVSLKKISYIRALYDQSERNEALRSEIVNFMDERGINELELFENSKYLQELIERVNHEELLPTDLGTIRFVDNDRFIDRQLDKHINLNQALDRVRVVDKTYLDNDRFIHLQNHVDFNQALDRYIALDTDKLKFVDTQFALDKNADVNNFVYTPLGFEEEDRLEASFYDTYKWVENWVAVKNAVAVHVAAVVDQVAFFSDFYAAQENDLIRERAIHSVIEVLQY